MQFVVTAYDGTDAGALERRLAAREQHLEVAKAMFEKGVLLYAAALLEDNGKMNGSVLICEFESREALQGWLDKEPYVTGDVWRQIDVREAKVPPFCQRV